MSIGVYSNNYNRENYSVKGNNPFANSNQDENNSFLEDYLHDDSEQKNNKTVDESDLETNITGTYVQPSQNVINDYIDNFLLINAEQVACTNMTQHLIRSDELKETLTFLNKEATKNIFKDIKSPNFAATKNISFKSGFLTGKYNNSNDIGMDKRSNFFIR